MLIIIFDLTYVYFPIYLSVYYNIIVTIIKENEDED